ERNPRKSYLFYGHKGPLGYTSSRQRFIDYLDKAGLADKRYTLHCLRHYAELKIMPSNTFNLGGSLAL
ncbi:MAG: hypothetical protein ABIG61_03560, partial [Planctomycetota bacterium]